MHVGLSATVTEFVDVICSRKPKLMNFMGFEESGICKLSSSLTYPNPRRFMLLWISSYGLMIGLEES